MGAYRCEQRQIKCRGRFFHFVSYEGQRPNVTRGLPGTLATWFLMSAGTRWEAAPQFGGEEPTETDRRLLEWLELTLGEPTKAPASITPLPSQPKPAMTRGLREILPQAD